MKIIALDEKKERIIYFINNVERQKLKNIIIAEILSRIIVSGLH